MRILPFILFLTTSLVLTAQEDEFHFPILSPPGHLIQQVGNTQVEVLYERPAARGRTIFGELVPWGELWRTGAGHCTRLIFSKDVVVGGQPITAGAYALFTIPAPNEWMVILNRDTSLYGAYGYDPAKDAARFFVRPQVAGRYYEALTIDLDLIPNNARLYLAWTDILVHFTIETTTDSRTQDFIERELLTDQATDSDLYAGAASYYLMSRKNLYDGLALSRKAIELDPDSGWARAVRIELLMHLRYWQQAKSEVERAIAASKQKEWPNEAEAQNDLEYWENLAKKIEEATGN